MKPPDTDVVQGRQDPLVGKRLASYEVLSRVARGGMGVVYRARHIFIDKIVALKVLDPALAARTDLIERFRTEAQSLARVEHENVIKVMDILEDKGVHFIVMDFAEGVNLRRHVKQHGPMPADELLSVARQVAEALFAAHREGILHRDIKPENLILNARGRCKLADFGLAGDLRLISEGHEGPLNFGTPAYSSPEVLRRLVPDGRSDIFSYAATLWFLATGEPPFGQEGIQPVLLRQKQGAKPLEHARPDLPVKMTRVINECLAWNPGDRPESFREVLDRLPRRAYPRAQPGGTEPTGMITTEAVTAEMPPSRRRIAWIATVLAITAAAVVAGVVWWATRDGDAVPEQPAITEVPQPAPPRQTPPVTNEPEPPAELPEEAAFNSAELGSRAALLRGDYKGAWDAWTPFILEHGESELQADAKSRRDDVASRVRALRESEYSKTRDAIDNALASDRTGEALAAVDRFPPELLTPLSDDDHIGVVTQLQTQRQRVEAAEATALARLLEQADADRRRWEQARTQPGEADEASRMQTAAILLDERAALERFLTGRSPQTREKVERRLDGLRRLLESVHQDSKLPAAAWRQYQDRTLGELALWLEEKLSPCTGMLSERDFTGALRHAREVKEQLESRTAELKTGFATVDALVRESTILGTAATMYAGDIRLALNAHALAETELRALVRSGAVRDYQVHASIEADGKRSVRVIRHTGRVASVSDGEFVVDGETGRATVSIDMLTVAAFRRLMAGASSPADRMSVLAWCALQGRDDDAAQELARLEGLESTDRAMLASARMLQQYGVPAPGALRTLRFLAAKSGLIARAQFEEAWGPAGELQGLLAAQMGAIAEDRQAAQDYVALVRRVEDPELVHLGAFSRALRLAAVEEADLLNRTRLEPLVAEAWFELARVVEEPSRARLYAARALLLDASHEGAWRMLR